MTAVPRSLPVAHLGGVPVGGDAAVVIVGVLNVSPESFYPGSVYAGEALMRAAGAMVDAGAAMLDIGAMSTAPYLAGRIDARAERDRLVAAIEVVASKATVSISVDTSRVEPAAAALVAGATVVNDVTGLADPALARLVAVRGVGCLAMASPASAAAGGRDPRTATAPVAFVARCLADALERARAAGIPDDRVVLDPGIGFFLDEPNARAAWDATILAGLRELTTFARPIAVGVSRKSFIGTLTGRSDPAGRLPGSLAATAVAVLGGAALVRTHDVPETRDAVRVAERVRAAVGE